jgi:transcriptional regulator with XRE-family HTH domain
MNVPGVGESGMTVAEKKPGAMIGAAIRKRRRQLHLTLQQLGEKSGVSYSYLSQVERDNATPTLGTLAQVAQALGVGIDYFIVTPRPSDAVTRAAQRLRFSINGSSIEYERLGAEFPGNELSAFVMHVPPGFRSETVSHEGEEIIYVLDGAITQVVDGTAFHLTAGDSLHYRGTSPHSYSNDSEGPTRILWSGTLTLFHTPGAAAFSPPPAAKNVGHAPKGSH